MGTSGVKPALFTENRGKKVPVSFYKVNEQPPEKKVNYPQYSHSGKAPKARCVYGLSYDVDATQISRPQMTFVTGNRACFFSFCYLVDMFASFRLQKSPGNYEHERKITKFIMREKIKKTFS